MNVKMSPWINKESIGCSISGAIVTIAVAAWIARGLTWVAAVNALLVVVPVTYLVSRLIQLNTASRTGLSVPIFNLLLMLLTVILWVVAGTMLVSLTAANGNTFFWQWF
jgi:hypothetical protein